MGPSERSSLVRWTDGAGLGKDFAATKPTFLKALGALRLLLDGRLSEFGTLTGENALSEFLSDCGGDGYPFFIMGSSSDFRF